MANERIPLQQSPSDDFKFGGVADVFGVLKRITPFVLPLWDKMLLRVVITECTAVLTVVNVVVIQRAIDEGLRQADAKAFYVWSAVTLIAVSVQRLFQILDIEPEIQSPPAARLLRNLRDRHTRAINSRGWLLQCTLVWEFKTPEKRRRTGCAMILHRVFE